MLNFTFSLDDTNIILAALSELPAKVSLNVINSIQIQAEPQVAAIQQAQAEAEANQEPETQQDG